MVSTFKFKGLEDRQAKISPDTATEASWSPRARPWIKYA